MLHHFADDFAFMICLKDLHGVFPGPAAARKKKVRKTAIQGKSGKWPSIIFNELLNFCRKVSTSIFLGTLV